MMLEFRVEGAAVSAGPGVTALDLFERAGRPMDPEMIGVMVGFRLKSLREPLLCGAEVRAVRLNASIGHKMYRRTLCFLLAKALEELYPGLGLRISHSIGGAYLFRLSDGSKTIDPSALEERMRHDVERDLPIEYRVLTFSEARRHLESHGNPDRLLLLEQKNEAEVPMFGCEGYWEPAQFPLAHRTGLLGVFRIETAEEGLLLHFPEKRWPLELSRITPQPVLDQVFAEYRRWADIVGVPTVARLNRLATSSDIQEIIQVCETLHEKKLGHIADRIAARPDVRVILVAGPSSSGKTTFTKKLAIHLRTVGLRPRIIGLDDYFVAREETPLDEEGKPDFESLGALDVELLNRHLVQLLNGETAEIPCFDFKTGRRKEQRRSLRLEAKDVLMMEGIHGLNEALTPLVPAANKFKIYISALTGLGLDSHYRISTTDNRLLRRLVRDAQFRGYSALHTLRIWPSVRRGEDRNIFPFQNSADAVFNSALDYEISVLKNYVVPLLKQVPPDDPQSTHSDRLLDVLENFVPIPGHLVPAYSILREFIGQSGFRY